MINISEVDPIIIYAIYYDPSDYPDKYVVRKWVGESPEEEPVCVVNDIESARKNVPTGMYKIPHQMGEDACIIESYI